MSRYVAGGGPRGGMWHVDLVDYKLNAASPLFESEPGSFGFELEISKLRDR